MRRMRVFTGLVLLALSGPAMAQLGPTPSTTQREGSQASGTIVRPEWQPQTPDRPAGVVNAPGRLGAPGDAPGRLGGAADAPDRLGGPGDASVRDLGNYGNLGLQQPGKPGSADANTRCRDRQDLRRARRGDPCERR